MGYEAWIKKALRYRDYAREDLINNRYDSAAFFAQQSVEFLLKGVLIKLTGSRPLTHSLSELLALLAKVLGVSVPEEAMRCAEALESHYIQARYPDARLNEYRKWEGEEAVKCMEALWEYVRQVAGGVA
ncbi:conserved hypothetical protein [Pyrobaculum aerophilum str. IM2]|uniref:HEPN domain-containing protein n=1 Tax=Pyrobaculum aerophilum (strain ATCC 51768 / DSM 7523 / JCM 9630 / CIP 104966 / NBRC 100827 / IM2) TaxID=178306 RepID=Q8ZWA3_PYRAE|nr:MULTISPECIES: HEPN domain-containing protein [Pyrobaculum]AAL63799.1 conserved hypothetical protein [Pyrobaculum aerophilum str. IM2]